LTLPVIMDRLLVTALTENAEAQRLLLMARNGLAAIAFLRPDPRRAAEIYRESLALAAANEAQVKGYRTKEYALRKQRREGNSTTGIDPLQELHIVHNLIDAETFLLQSGSGMAAAAATDEEQDQPSSVLQQANIARLCRKRDSLVSNYIAKRRTDVDAARHQLEGFTPEVTDLLSKSRNCWIFALAAIKAQIAVMDERAGVAASPSPSTREDAMFRELASRCNTILADYPRNVFVPATMFSSFVTLQSSLELLYQRLLSSREEQLQNLLAAGHSGNPEPGQVRMKGNCGTCAKHFGGNGPPCLSCRLGDGLKTYSQQLHGFMRNSTDGASSKESAVSSSGNWYVRRGAPILALVKEIIAFASTISEHGGASAAVVEAGTATNIQEVQSAWAELYPALSKEENHFKRVSNCLLLAFVK